MENIICIEVANNEVGVQQTIDVQSSVTNSSPMEEAVTDASENYLPNEKNKISITEPINEQELLQKEAYGNILLILGSQDINPVAHQIKNAKKSLIDKKESFENQTDKDINGFETSKHREIPIGKEINSVKNRESEIVPFSTKEEDPHFIENKKDEAKKKFHCRYCERTMNYRKESGDNQDIPLIVKRIQCPICSKFLAPSTKLDVHMRTHTGERPFPCDKCSKAFKRADNLAAHKRKCQGEKQNIALKTEKVQCKICARHFVGRAALLRHNFHKHMEKTERSTNKPNGKRFLCDICPKIFHSKTALNTHRRIHSGEKPFVCLDCGKAFVSSSGRSNHSKIHSGIKEYSCQICQKSFSHQSSLCNHMRVHSGQKPYECEVCSKRFVYSNDLKIHQRIHTGEKPYVCNVCSRPFGRSTHLKTHYRVHTKEKPYVCEICGKAFTQKSTLNSHKKRHVADKMIKKYEGL